MSTTTAICTSFKRELLSGAHNFLVTQAAAAHTATTTAPIPGLSTAVVAGLVVGMAISAANWPAGTLIKSIDSATQVTATNAPSASVSSSTFTADSFKLALVKS